MVIIAFDIMHIIDKYTCLHVTMFLFHNVSISYSHVLDHVKTLFCQIPEIEISWIWSNY